MVVDGEEGAAAVDHFPVCDDRLAGVAEGHAVVDAAGVEAEGRAGKNLVPVVGAAGVGVEKADFEWVVEVGSLDIATGSSAVLVVDGVDVDPEVVYAGDFADGLGERSEGEVGVDDAVVSLTRVVLNLLQEHDGWSVEVVDNVLSNERDARIVRCEVFDVVLAECEPAALAVGDDGRGRWERIDGALDFGTSLREDSVEAEDVCDDASDVLELVAKLGLFAVAASVQGCTNDDGLWVGVAVCYGQTATRVLSRGFPVSSYPLVAKGVGLTA